MYRFSVETRARTQFINIDSQIRKLLTECGLEAGILQLHVPHTTAGITINENADPDVPRDMELVLDRMVPWHDPAYRHAEGNTAAHVKASMTGVGCTLIIEGGRPCLGVWQSVFFCEFDGPRRREVWAVPVPLPTKE
ncbi:MAG TPA: secondary thiamine-phosphate synthase enzyme YjbQ [Candidatus Hydrogenedentes bacterium]|jgi:secondary thiamine-phosphate synthase enzyme|nr:MAG: hypothetical protein BWY07_00540 [Candidatus Hydrogenedentes bacterium ADurb.Bin170]HOD94920.1 secondary thiamine-phosphate synthase enzyme YjbQ [Candidatus Hydrogenedentota bacterium]HOM47515.1 secondary thiamine-phosphate synthase enzyme YjbQ [Candidatus Hydrogenedentota bacterium]HOR51235.1 secondary thiamine-phosphate synthase enzyme YjbQ [Candidatus Hydrogenedentota bacterium]HPK24685.1 secondary thiamine-phosphate synthase enzyme YjbQ [Candidatus Hydrogenedentota bacterium]